MTLPQTTRCTPTRGTTRLVFAWDGDVHDARRTRWRPAVAAVLIVGAAAAFLSLGRQLAAAMDSMTPEPARTTVTNAALPIIFGATGEVAEAKPEAQSSVTELVTPETIAMAQCDFFPDRNCQPLVAVVEHDSYTPGGQGVARIRLRVFSRDDDRWVVAFEHYLDDSAGRFNGMTPRDHNNDGVPELATWWEQADGSICTRLLCRTAGRLELISASPYCLMQSVPPLEPATMVDHRGMADLTLNLDLPAAENEAADAALIATPPSR